ncbi:uncharacterized protein LOC142350853 isoform X2 [Convolutriloba macropyga]|uniref:uncharacterized protein LOC142350853 isoform X2 n=1 Tax=Convolutriloba macropyga TaxID=536237 RepID=UPI003F5282FD
MPYRRSVKVTKTPKLDLSLDRKLTQPYKNSALKAALDDQEYELARAARRRARMRSLEREAPSEVEVVRYNNVGSLATAGDIFATQLYQPVQYLVDAPRILPAAQTIAYYRVIDPETNQQMVVPANNMYLNINQPFMHPATSMYPTHMRPGVYEIEAPMAPVAPIVPQIGEDCYEIVEETVSGDTDPFGMVQKRRTLKDGILTKQQEVLDLTIKEGGRYYTAAGKLPELDLAEAKGLSRSAVRNRIDKKTDWPDRRRNNRGQQHIQYVYEGFNNADGKVTSVPYDYTYDTSYISDLGSKPLTYYTTSTDDKTTSKYLTKGAGDSYLTGLNSRPKRANRFSYKTTDTSYEIKSKDDKPTYSYLDYLYFPSENFSDEKASAGSKDSSKIVKINTSGVSGVAPSGGLMPFGLDYEDLMEDEDGVFGTVQVDLRRGKGGKDGDGVDYGKIVLPGKFPGSRRRHNSFDGGIPGYVRNVPSLAGHLAGRIVNDALDGMFRHGSVGSGRVPKTTLTPTPSATSTYRRSPSSKISSRSAHKSSSKPRPREYISDFSSEHKRRQQKWMEDYEREERDRERRRKDREMERKAELRRLESDWEKEKRERERREEDRKRDRDLERRRREAEWEAQQAEWERERQQREREREKLRKERERIEEEARLKAQQKFDPRVHTVEVDDNKPEDDSATLARPTVVPEPVVSPRSPGLQTRPKKKVLNEVAEHDPGEVKNDRDPGVWEGHGHFKDERVIFNSESGHISWTKPKGSLEVIYKNPDGILEFGCKVEPKNEGMKVYEVREDAEVLISTGKGGDLGPLEFSSIDGVVIIVIETYEDEELLPSDFRLDWTLHA